ncbi:nucleoside-diphosphate kinase [Candidatus Pantoea edessiphila]|uniref:Nucleoside diphosphate kinase n=1 Tax=Candidatus Pantoea edessiphila TaxID=2044610 RepID=A0A2P5SYE9_9GAMM|nr:nucleoside-diphosphate kinase [Candidatus Pantoea edessiphila]MBK4775518.1 nucleoside-diphosphate kinase [Pantoea sp. Edef]PPI87355.1 nucleoside-diphosphate kinase [Candidatus Pantoea edessiphila]
MTIERTLAIIKPNLVAKNLIGEIINRFEIAGFKIIAIKMIQLTKAKAERLYNQHIDKHFFSDLINFMISGPIVVSILECENAIELYRNLIGDTNPMKAEKGTLRAYYANSHTENGFHGSDSKKSAIFEINVFFKKNEIYSNID